MALVLDNGSYSLKVGFSKDEQPRSIPNFVFKSKAERRRVFVGSEIDECKDLSGLFYVAPFQKGFQVNWDVQRQIWDHAFGPSMLNVSCDGTDLLMTEPVYNFPSVQDSQLEVFFEEYNFNSLAVRTAPLLSCHHYTFTHDRPPCCLVVDMGYAFTHVVPFYQNRMVSEAVRRFDVGGKILTNYLKEVVSYRQLQVLDETYVMNQVKEDVCYVSMDFAGELKEARAKPPNNTIAVDYVLPDFTTRRRGYIRNAGSNDGSCSSSGKSTKKDAKGKKDEQTTATTTAVSAEEQSLRLANERISIPEVLFHPTDMGMHQMGLAEAVYDAIASTPPPMRPHLFNNIVLTGGCARFPNMRGRVMADIRKMAPEEVPVRVFLPDRPDLYAWEGGKMAAESECFKEWVVRGAEYRETGHLACLDKLHQSTTCTFEGNAKQLPPPPLSEV